jgi:predicted transcriptional regulator
MCIQKSKLQKRKKPMNLFQFTRSKGIEPETLATLAKTTYTTIYRVSKGISRPSFSTLQKLKSVLGEEVEQCFIVQDEPVALVDLEAC